jgi:predicted RND superfamily exporter protein
VEMIRRMGIVTLFCNLTAAIGFGVFALTRSAILNEFGVVAGINIMLLFFISFILIPIVLSYLPPPKPRHMRYLDNKLLVAILDRLEIWSTNHRRLVYAITAIVLMGAIAGMFRLKSEGFIVDDLPKKDPIYTDLKFFEMNFRGVMPLEIVIDTKRKKGMFANLLQTLDSMEKLSQYIYSQPEMARPLSLVEGLKFMRQAYYGGDSASYGLPNSFDLPLMASYLHVGGEAGKSGLNQLLRGFVDSNQQQLRISVNMADVGSARLPAILEGLEKRSRELFDSSRYKVEFTGTSVTYLEGSSFIIKGLKDSIEWAFVLIAACMLFLFRSFRILLCSLIPNVIPLIITAGVMGWVGVRLKPSTVIVFSIALGIAIDITIRFLVNYKQEAAQRKAAGGGASEDPHLIVIDTIHKTGISILYTSMVLIVGFVIFCFSDFGGIQALGWLTSVTLVIATVTNLVFLPALLMSLMSPRSRS